MSHEDIEATKAPLMEHLIELRARLIKALLAFGAMFLLCFFLAKQIYNVLVWPFVWIAGAEHSKFIYTALLEYFVTQIKLAGLEKDKVYHEEPIPEAELRLSQACDLYFKIADQKDTELPAIKFKAAYLYYKHNHFVAAAERYFEII